MDKKFYENEVDSKTIKAESLYIDYYTPPHFHKAIELQYILKNNYEVTIQDKTHVIEKDCIVLIPPYMPHTAKEQKEVKTILLVIPYQFLTHFRFFLKASSSCFILNDTNFNKEKLLPILMMYLQNKMQQENLFGNNDILINSSELGWVNVLFSLIFSYYDLNLSSDKSSNSAIKEVLDYIDCNYNHSNLSSSTLSGHFGYNPSYFSRLFKENISTTPTKYINQVRIQKFIDFYTNDMSQNILSLALDCGFTSQATFYRAFYEFTKTSPKNYFIPNDNY